MANDAEQHIFQDEGREYYFWTVGEKSKPWVLLIPGYTSTHADLLPLARTMDEKYFVIIPDLPGWGKSSQLPTKLYIQTYATYLHTLMEHMGAKEFFLVGYCFGAVIALTYLLNYPEKVKGSVFVSTPYLKGSFIQELPFYCAEVSTHLPMRMRPLLFLWRNRLTAVPFAFFHLHIKSVRKRIHHILKDFTRQSLQNERAVEENWISLGEYKFGSLQKITMPVHLIHGKDDVLVPISQAKKFQQLFADATLDVIPDAGHWVPAEKPHMLGAAIAKYLL